MATATGDADQGPLWPLVEALQRVPCLSDRSGRRLVAELVCDELRERLPFEEHERSVLHLYNLVEVCGRHPRGLDALLQVLERIEAGSKSELRVREIVAGMTATTLQPVRASTEEERAESGSLWPLLDALRRIGWLSDLSGRNLVVRMVSAEIGRQLPVEENRQQVGHLYNLAEACAQHPGGLAALVRVLERIEHGSKPMALVRATVAEMTADTVPPAVKVVRPELEWDFFISHASEDKLLVAGPLANLLKSAGFSVWYDDFTLRVGDSLVREIDRGLRSSRYGVVVLSESFFGKQWPQRELAALLATANGERRVLPVWHGLDALAVARYSPMVADLKGVCTSLGLDAVAQEIVRAVSP
ncbi:MAG TPA: toll/interleukin-1 receptor domain-containing protein [Lentzea sp.]